MKPIAYSYLRFSTPEQAKGDSTRRQQELAIKYAEEHGLELDTSLTLTDAGVSAFRGKNVEQGALGRFLDAINEGQVKPGSFLLVESLDRISRANPIDALTPFSQIINAGVTIVTLADGVEHSRSSIDSNHFNLFGSLMVMMRAHEESQIKSKRVAASREQARTLARTAGRKMTALAPYWMKLTDDRKAFDLIPERVEVVQRIYSMAAEGHGSRAIANTFNREKLPAFGRSKGWHQSYVTKVLTGRAVLGEWQPHKYITDEQGNRVRVPEGSPIEGYFPQVIDSELFNQVQTQRNEKALPPGPRLAFENIFRGLLYCECGARLKHEDKGKPPKGGKYYYCADAHRKLCTAKRVRVDVLEPLLLLSLTKIDFGNITRTKLAKSEVIRLQDEAAALRHEIAEGGERVSKLVEFIEQGDDSKTVRQRLIELERGLADLEHREQQAARSLEKALREQQDDTKDLQAMFNAVVDVLHIIAYGEAKEARQIRQKANTHIRRYVDKIELTRDTQQSVIRFKAGTSEAVLVDAGVKNAIGELVGKVEKIRKDAVTSLIIPLPER